MFSILDRLGDLKNVEEYPSYVRASCPVCNGLLKISKSDTHYGAYKCWTSYCTAQDIRAKLPDSSPSVFSQVSVFKKSSVFSQSPSPLIVETQLPKLFNFVLLKKVLGISKRTGNRINYIYAEDKRVTRYDNSNKKGERKKAIIPEYFDEVDQVWRFGKNNTVWPPYGLNEVNVNIELEKQTNSNYTPNSTALLVVEGEKTCDFVRRLGICCITFQTSQYGILLIKEQLESLVSKVGLVVYIEDNDLPGRHKGVNFKKGAALAKIASVVIPYNQLQLDALEEQDLADSPYTDKTDLINDLTRFIDKRNKI
jgi:hypothetical protein